MLALLIALIPIAMLTGCVNTTMDFALQGPQPIPAKLVKEMGEKGMTPASPILVRIFKLESELEVWKQDKSGKFALMKTYPMCRWSGELGPKKTRGDRQAPEGFYNISVGSLNPKSDYNVSFNLGYPNRLERALGYSGDSVMVHGACSSSGCYAISDQNVSEVYSVAREALKGGQKNFQVEAFPFRMNAENLARFKDNANMPFWLDLKRGHDYFEVKKAAPPVTFCEGRYHFGEITSGKAPESPLGKCPQFAPFDAEIAKRTDTDLAEMAKLSEKVKPGNLAYVHLDGGMHPAFRKLLATKGPAFLARQTSGTKVPVSRPRAALADPYTVKPVLFKKPDLAP